MSTGGDAVLSHHRAAAEMWDQGGRDYDHVSFAISDALKHAAQRLDPREGDRVLDVATGTGWSARNVARMGANVTAVDIADGLLAVARELSAHIRPSIEFQLADAERLPFADGVFDSVISTFGVIFANNQAQAAAELGRVCRPGGRVVLASWALAGSAAEFFGIIGKYRDAPPPSGVG
jgi:ubiquinone/menaquinone biosynthesis C-methylase UbiE